MSHRFQRTVRLLGFGLAICECHLAMAQAPTPAPVAPAPIGGGGAYIVRSLWVEVIITVVMIGIALFAICKTSNRS